MTDELKAILISAMDSCRAAGIGYIAFTFDTQAGEIVTYSSGKASGPELAGVLEDLAKRLKTSKLNFIYTGEPS